MVIEVRHNLSIALTVNKICQEVKDATRIYRSDIVSILHVFSCRLYGLRKYKKQIERDEEIAKGLQDGNQSVKRTDGQNQ